MNRRGLIALVLIAALGSISSGCGDAREGIRVSVAAAHVVGAASTLELRVVDGSRTSEPVQISVAGGDLTMERQAVLVVPAATGPDVSVEASAMDGSGRPVAGGSAKASLVAGTIVDVHVTLSDQSPPDSPFVAPVLTATDGPVTAMLNWHIDADELPDLVAATAHGLYVLKNLGGGMLGAPVALPAANPPATVNALAAGDLDGSGRPTILAACDDGRVLKFPVMVGGTIGAPIAVPSGRNIRDIVVLDVDGDGSLDVAVADQGLNRLSIAFGRGAARTTGIGFSPHALVARDLNADGKIDFAAVSNSGGAILLGDGTGTFAAPASFDLRGNAILARDLDGDGRPDLVAAGPGGAWSARNQGAGKFDSAVQIVGGSAPSLVMSDVTGDGPIDLVVPFETDDTVSVLPGDGRGSFVAPLEPIRLAKPTLVLMADLEQDGRPELVVGGEAGVFVFARTPKP